MKQGYNKVVLKITPQDQETKFQLTERTHVTTLTFTSDL